MKNYLSRSFRNRLFATYLTASLVPLLICSVLLLQIFRARLTTNAEADAQANLRTVSQAMDDLYQGFVDVAALAKNPVVVSHMQEGSIEDVEIYSLLFDATEGMRGYARFDLYDAEGKWRYSTHAAPESDRLPTSWGVLNSAASPDGPLTFIAPENAASADDPLFQEAVLIIGEDNNIVGYLLFSTNRGNFRFLLDGMYGDQNVLLILNRYWRPVYCTQSIMTVPLASRLRHQLLNGSLDEASDDYIYNVAYHQPTGLFIILQRPQIFNRNTMNIVYTVSFFSALVCVLLSIFMNIQLSRQLFSPIERLHRAIEEVTKNNLEAYVYHDRQDELGQLSDQFNGMLVALKRNREQLIENRRELNEAQIRMLQAQLNPHFLCNTLDTMKWISKIHKVPEVALMATNLAGILRLCISPDEFIPLYLEIEIIQRYMEIQNIRLSNIFEFHVTVPPELEGCMVPKMMLQPIVENAILHGFEGADSGSIWVEARSLEQQSESSELLPQVPMGGNLLQITVSDNGCGLPPELEGRYGKRDKDSYRGHLGLYNVDTILSKHYGTDFGLFLSNRKDGSGAVVTTVLPIRIEEG